ncbi:hypothetical protein ACFCP7_10575 [Paenibacillus elgii]
MEEPKTVSECWDIYKRFGFTKPEKPVDDSLFPNARQLVRMHNAHLDEIDRLTEERDAIRVGRSNEMILKNEVIRQCEELEAANTAMREVLEWYGDDKNHRMFGGAAIGTYSNIQADSGHRARSVLAKIGEGEQP